MIELIEKYICKERGIKPEQLYEKQPNGKLKRNRELVICRQLIAYYALQNGYTEREIGECFNGQDHSTVHHAKKKISDLCDVYRDFRYDIAEYDKHLLGLNKLTYKEIVDKLKYNSQEKVEFIKAILPELETKAKDIEKRLESINSIIFDLQEETSRIDVEPKL